MEPPVACAYRSELGDLHPFTKRRSSRVVVKSGPVLTTLDDPSGGARIHASATVLAIVPMLVIVYACEWACACASAVLSSATHALGCVAGWPQPPCQQRACGCCQGIAKFVALSALNFSRGLVWDRGRAQGEFGSGAHTPTQSKSNNPCVAERSSRERHRWRRRRVSVAPCRRQRH